MYGYGFDLKELCEDLNARASGIGLQACACVTELLSPSCWRIRGETKMVAQKLDVEHPLAHIPPARRESAANHMTYKF